MARVSTPTKLPVDTYAILMGMDLCLFNGVKHPHRTSRTKTCGRYWYQYGRQLSAQLGREDVGLKINYAEGALESALGFFVAPTYMEDEVVDFQSKLNNQMRTNRKFRTKFGYVLKLGIRRRELVEKDVKITYIDTTGDGITDTASFSVSIPEEAKVCDIGAYYPGKVEEGEFRKEDVTWEFRPLEKVGVGNTVEFVGSKCQFVLWDKHRAGEIVTLDDDSSFYDTVDVFWTYIDNETDEYVSLLYEVVDEDYCSSEDSYAPAFARQSGKGAIYNSRLGFISVAPYVFDSGKWSRKPYYMNRLPDKAMLSYLSGWQDFDNTISLTCDRFGILAEVIKSLTNTYLPYSPCECIAARRLYADDIKELDSATRGYVAANELFGSMRFGAVKALQFYNSYGVKVTGGFTR